MKFKKIIRKRLKKQKCLYISEKLAYSLRYFFANKCLLYLVFFDSTLESKIEVMVGSKQGLHFSLDRFIQKEF